MGYQQYRKRCDPARLASVLLRYVSGQDEAWCEERLRENRREAALSAFDRQDRRTVKQLMLEVAAHRAGLDPSLELVLCFAMEEVRCEQEGGWMCAKHGIGVRCLCPVPLCVRGVRRRSDPSAEMHYT